MSLSTIPSLCLLNILDRIPLHDLLSTANLVCHRWAKLRPVACHRRHSLFLCDSKDYLDHLGLQFSRDHDVKSAVVRDDDTPLDGWIYVKYQLGQNGLRFALQLGTQDRVLGQLLNLLPNISKLQLGQSVICWPSVIQAVNRLLEKWSTKLAHLNLWLYNKSQAYEVSRDNSYHSTLIDQLFDRLNQLTALRRLTVEFRFPYRDQTLGIEHKFTSKLTTVLSRVDHFEYGGDYRDQVFEGYILRDLETVLKRQSQLKTITLRPNIKMAYTMSRFSPSFTSKLTTFTVGLGFDDGLSDLVISRLSSIETLYVQGDPQVDISFPDLIGQLSHLSRLTFLAFSNDFPKCFFKNVKQSQPLRQIRSLKALRIQLKSPLSHHYITQLSIPTLFPNIQVIKLNQTAYVTSFIACIECNYKLDSFPAVYGAPLDGESEAMFDRCGRLTLESLNKCNQKCVINFSRSGSGPYGGALYIVFDATYTPGQI